MKLNPQTLKDQHQEFFKDLTEMPINQFLKEN